MLIVSENASAKFGGEAILPLHYFRRLRARGIEAWLVVNARTRWELQNTLTPKELARVSFVADTKLHHWLEVMAKPFPPAIKYLTFRFAGRIISQLRARRISRQLVREHRIDVVHQPTPVSPRESSLLHKMGAPVVIGPLNGGMSYPPAFRAAQEKAWVVAFVNIGRRMAGLLNFVMPGKTRAATVLVANERTRRALPPGIRGRVAMLVENGVDLRLWAPADREERGEPAAPVRFAFTGRLVRWKGVDLLLNALANVRKTTPATLDVLGGGEVMEPLRAQAAVLGIADAVTFHGMRSQAEAAEILRRVDAFVLPSLFECGGAVVLEAMAASLPVIATNWGGPADYLDPACGILVDPKSREQFIADLTAAMLDLANDASRRRAMGAAGRAKAAAEFDWERKIDTILGFYADAIARAKP